MSRTVTPAGSFTRNASQGLPIVDQVLRSGGKPLEDGTRAFMETRLGHDFSGVRIHADESSARSAQAVAARAYTVGRDVIFGRGNYRPATAGGQRLLAHELAHVVQQRNARATKESLIISNKTDPAEREAAAAATAIGRGQPTQVRSTQSTTLLQRQPTVTTHGVTPVPDKSEAGLPTKVVAHGASSDAVKLAKERMTEVVGGLKNPTAGELKGKTIELHIIPQDKKLTDLPEFASLKGTKTFDGRTYDELRGVGATKVGDIIRYAIAEEQLISVKGKPSAYALGFVAAHESGHVVEQFGLSKEQKKALQEAYNARKAAKGPWLSPAWYTSSGTGEYFAQSTSAYFGRPYSSSETDKKTYTRDWLTKNDAGMYKLLASVYT